MIEYSIRRPVSAWILMFALITFGAVCLNRMGVSQMPDVDFPILNISVNYEGAAPEVVEADLISPLEERLLTIEGIKEMRSNAGQGSGRITLEFDINRNIDVALQEVQSAISQFRMPLGADPAIIRKQNPEEDPILYVSIYGSKDFKETIRWTQNFLLDQLRFLPGVGAIDVGGFSERNVRIWFDRAKLDAYDLSVQDVIEALRSQHIESAAGQFTEGQRELRVRWLGEASDIESIKDLAILRRGGQLISNSKIRIKDVARVEDGLSDVRRIARFEDHPTLSLRISKQRGSNEIEVSQAIQSRLQELAKDFPEGYGYRVNVDFTQSTKATIDLTIEKIWVAGVITILVCFFFLGSVQAAVNILFSIPTSIVGTFIILKLSGFTLNLFTLLALTLSISIVVDDAIMLLENIVRHYRRGKGSQRAAADGAREVLPAASAATLAMVAIFLPVVFMEGVIGKFFYQFGVTISAAVLISLLEAVIITPMRAAAFLSGEPKIGRFERYMDHVFERCGETYRRWLQVTLRWRYLVLAGSLSIFVGSLVLVKKLRQEFIPAQDQNIIMVFGQAPSGSSLEKTDRLATEVENVLRTVPEIASYLVSIGSGGSGGPVNQFMFPLRLTPKEQRSKTHVEVMAELRKKFKAIPDVRLSMRDISSRNLSSGRQSPLGLNLRGPDLNILNAKAQELIKALEEQKLGVDLDSDYRAGIPELRIEPNREAMAKRGVSVDAVGQVLSAAVGGLRQGRYTADGRRYDVRFKLPDDMVHSAADIRRLQVRNMAGNLIPLKDLITITEAQGSQGISRVNRMRAISVFGNIAPGQSQAVVLQKAQEIAKRILPPSYVFALEGASAGFTEAFSSLSIAMLVGILVAYMILAIQFNSFVHPISVLMALPFSVTGALLALWICGVSLNLFSFIGLIVLMGIAKKNSILLVEFTNHIRREKSGTVTSALLEACPVRLRPIIMTSVATVAAASPLVFGGGMGSEARMPMGLAIMGGTILSTLLTLFVVPSIYLVLASWERQKTKTHMSTADDSAVAAQNSFRSQRESSHTV